MSKRKNGRLFILIVIAVGLVIGLLHAVQTTIANSFLQKNLNDEAIEQYVEYAEMASRACENDIESYFAHLDQYVNSEVAQTGDKNKVYEWLMANINIRPECISYMGYADAKGFSCNDLGGGSNISSRDYYQALAAGADRYIDNPTIARTSQRLIVHVTRAVKDRQTKKFIGLFYAVVELDRISSFLKKINIGDSGYAIMTARDGSIVGTSLEDKSIVEENNALMEEKYPESYEKLMNVIKSPNEEYGELISGTGKYQLFFAVPITGTNLKIILILDKADVQKSAVLVKKILLIGSVAVVFAIVILVGLLLYKSLAPLKIVEDTVRDIASGDADLTKRININVNNEIGRVVEGYNSFAEKLQSIVATMKESKNGLIDAGNLLRDSTSDTSDSISQIISQIQEMSSSIDTQNDSVHETAGAVNEIAANIESLNRMIEGQVDSVSQASVAVEEMIGNITSVNSSVQKMAVQFAELEEKSRRGVEKQNDVNNKIEEIVNDSKALQSANAVISSIAAQTNMLAMNAAIEAAHAGDSGKGFSVVADEIRKLSEDSSVQSKSIGTQLSKITNNISAIVKASKDASLSFLDVSSGINATNNLVQEITNAMIEQQEGSKQISSALSSMNDSSNEVKTASFEMAEGNKAIISEIKKLQDSTFAIKDTMGMMNDGARKISETGLALNDISDKMESSIQVIGNQVDKFKV